MYKRLEKKKYISLVVQKSSLFISGITETSENHDINFYYQPRKQLWPYVVEFLLLDIQEDDSDNVVFRPRIRRHSTTTRSNFKIKPPRVDKRGL
jgi:hypothetical protein